MHIIYGENGEVSHSHHHEHEKGCCCGHDHDHDHGHCHDHDHGEEHCHDHHHDHGEGHCHDHHHDHDHCHSHSHEEGCHKEQDETVAVLTYMLDHNVHHAAELESMAAELRKQGKTAAADMIDKGVVDFQTANMRLRVALSMLSEQA